MPLRNIDNGQGQRRHPPLPAKLRQDLSKSLTHSTLRTCLSRCHLGLGDSGDERLMVLNSVAKSIVDSSTVLARNGGALQRYRHASDERFSLEEGASESGEVLAGGKPS